jgi:hypothetical protein
VHHYSLQSLSHGIGIAGLVKADSILG